MTDNKDKKITLKDKLLGVISEMEKGRVKVVKIEDVYVKAFKMYASDFQLRGYSEFPDTEIMSKRIYDLRKAGFIHVARKFIKLTNKGRVKANILKKCGSNATDDKKKKNVLSRDIESEINRIKQTEAYKLFISNRSNEIVDSDLFSYLGATVKTERTSFSARIRTINDVIEEIKDMNDLKMIKELHDHLFLRFKLIIDEKLVKGYPRR